MNQPIDQPLNQPLSLDQGSSNTVWYVAGGAAIIIAALVVWYFFGMTPPVADTSSTAIEQTQIVPPANNTVGDISADLNQIPDDTAVLNQDAAAAAQAVQGL